MSGDSVLFISFPLLSGFSFVQGLAAILSLIFFRLEDHLMPSRIILPMKAARALVIYKFHSAGVLRAYLARAQCSHLSQY
jgi:hypothetical protein